MWVQLLLHSGVRADEFRDCQHPLIVAVHSNHLHRHRQPRRPGSHRHRDTRQMHQAPQRAELRTLMRFRRDCRERSLRHRSLKAVATYAYRHRPLRSSAAWLHTFSGRMLSLQIDGAKGMRRWPFASSMDPGPVNNSASSEEQSLPFWFRYRLPEFTCGV